MGTESRIERLKGAQTKMGSHATPREYAHELIERLSPERVQALLDLLDEDVFSQDEIAEIRQLQASKEWTEWRGLRDDV